MIPSFAVHCYATRSDPMHGEYAARFGRWPAASGRSSGPGASAARATPAATPGSLRPPSTYMWALWG